MDSVNFETKNKRTTGQKHGDLRAELFGEGLSVLDIHVIEGVTIRAVARNANVAQSVPVDHFPSRKVILVLKTVGK